MTASPRSRDWTKSPLRAFAGGSACDAGLATRRGLVVGPRVLEESGLPSGLFNSVPLGPRQRTWLLLPFFFFLNRASAGATSTLLIA